MSRDSHDGHVARLGFGQFSDCGVAQVVEAAVEPGPLTAPKEKHYASAVGHLLVGAISIVRRKSNAAGVHRRSFAPQVAVGDYLFIGRSQRDKQFARWQARRITSVRNERTKSKLCSPNSSTR